MGSATKSLTGLLLGCVTILAQPTAPASPGEKSAWFKEAKFGLAIHWGLYSIPAGQWKGQAIPGSGDAIMRSSRIPAKEYAQLASQFNPKAFDAEAWAKFAEESGAKYVVFAAKDKDGFAMYRSAASKFNVYDATPFHLDPLRELAAACAKHKIRLGVSYALEDWHEPNGAGNDWDFGAGVPKDFASYLRLKVEPQLKEILTGYGQISLISFDTAAGLSAAQRQSIDNLVHSLQPATLIGGPPGTAADFLSFEAGRIPAPGDKAMWQVSDSVNHTIGFKADDNVWQSTDDLIFKLVDIGSRGGNYVLNAGPTAAGIIPRPILVTGGSIGAWLKQNGDAIYGAGPTPFGDELGVTGTVPPGPKWRCTTKQGKLFITLFQWPEGPLELTQLKDKVTKAYLLNDPSKALAVSYPSGHASVLLPKDPPVDGPGPDRISPRLMMMAARAHVRTVVVLETQRK